MKSSSGETRCTRARSDGGNVAFKAASIFERRGRFKARIATSWNPASRHFMAFWTSWATVEVTEISQASEKSSVRSATSTLPRPPGISSSTTAR